MPRFGRVLTAMVTPFDADGELNVDAAVAPRPVARRAGQRGPRRVRHDRRVADAVDRREADAVRNGGVRRHGAHPRRHHRVQHRPRHRPHRGGRQARASPACWPSARSTAARRRPGWKRTSGRSPAPPTCRSLLYDIPVRTGRKIDSTTLVRLAADVPNIVGVKDAAGNPGATAAVKANTPDRLRDLLGRRRDDAAAPGDRRRRRDRRGDALVRARSGRDVRCLGTRRRRWRRNGSTPASWRASSSKRATSRRTRYRPRP